MSDAASPVAPAGIWVQLLVGEEKQGQSFEIIPIPENVDALKMAVFPELTPREVAKCRVYAPGTAFPVDASIVPLHGWDSVPETTGPKPLIVVAPPPQKQEGLPQQQQDVQERPPLYPPPAHQQQIPPPSQGTYVWEAEIKDAPKQKPLDDQEGRVKKKLKRATQDYNKFHSPLDTVLPKLHEKVEIQPFLAPPNWLEDTCTQVLRQADLRESNNPRVSPIALIRCSRGGKTRSMIELTKTIRDKDSSYGIVYVTFNTATPLQHKLVSDPMGELCVRIAFAALKGRMPHDAQEFFEFSSENKVDEKWVEDWLGNQKCILLIDELNLLQDAIDAHLAFFLKNNFLLGPGRGMVYSSRVPSLNRKLSDLMGSHNNREFITLTLPVIPSLQEARTNFKYPTLSAQEALFLGLIPGLISERKNKQPISHRRASVVASYVQYLTELGGQKAPAEVRMLLSTLLTGNVDCVHESLRGLMTADLKDDEVILRWIPFHMIYALSQIYQHGIIFLPGEMRSCLEGIVGLFRQFESSKGQSGDAWEALFLIVLLVRCLTGSFDETVVPLRSRVLGDVPVAYNCPFDSTLDFCTETDPIRFIGGIPDKSRSVGTAAISIYYPGHAKFAAYDVILAAWDAEGNRYLYGYQLKEGSTIPRSYVFNQFCRSYLIRGTAPRESASVRMWRSVSDAELDTFFGVSAAQWSAEQWKKLQQGEIPTNGGATTAPSV